MIINIISILTNLPPLEVPASLSFMCIPTYSGEEGVLNDGIWLQTEAFAEELEPNWAKAVFEDDDDDAAVDEEDCACEHDAPDCDLEHEGPEASYISAEEDDANDCLRDNKTPTLLEVHDDEEDAADDDVEDEFAVFVADADAVAEAEAIFETDADEADVDMAEWFCIKFAFNCDADVEAEFWSMGSIMFP